MPPVAAGIRKHLPNVMTVQSRCLVECLCIQFDPPCKFISIDLDQNHLKRVQNMTSLDKYRNMLRYTRLDGTALALPPGSSLDGKK